MDRILNDVLKIRSDEIFKEIFKMFNVIMDTMAHLCLDLNNYRYDHVMNTILAIH